MNLRGAWDKRRTTAGALPPATMKFTAEKSDRVRYEPVGKTTMGNEYTSFVISSPDNLARLGQILEANRKLADPRDTTPEEARALVEQTVPVHCIGATGHPTEVRNAQTVSSAQVARTVGAGTAPAT